MQSIASKKMVISCHLSDKGVTFSGLINASLVSLIVIRQWEEFLLPLSILDLGFELEVKLHFLLPNFLSVQLQSPHQKPLKIILEFLGKQMEKWLA